MSSSSDNKLIDAQEWRSHGLMILPCLMGMTLIAVHPYSLGVMFEPLEKEFGWTRGEISAGPLVTSITALFIAPFAGRFLDSLGPRKTALIGIPLYAVAISMIALSGPSYLSWLALYCLLSFAIVLIYPTVWTKAIAERFENNRGMAMAIALSGTGVAGAVVPLLSSMLIQEYGWRGAYMGFGVMTLVIVFPAILFLFARSKPIDQGSQESTAEAQTHVAPERPSLKKALSPKAIRLTLAAFIYSIGATGLAINAVPILREEGFDLTHAAEIAGLIGLGTIIGRLAGGILLDRVDGRFVAMGCGVAALISAAILLSIDHSGIAASIACVMLGLAAGAEFDACAYLTSRHFHRDNFGTVFGLISGVSGFASGIAPFILNTAYDLSGSYNFVLIAMFPMFALASLLFLSLGRYPAALASPQTT